MSIPETPSMDPQLLAVEITKLQHAMPGKERVGMVQATPAIYQTGKPFLIPEQRPTKGHIPTTLKIPPHHQTILQVWEDQPIIQRQKGLPPGTPDALPNTPRNRPTLALTCPM